MQAHFAFLLLLTLYAQFLSINLRPTFYCFLPELVHVQIHSSDHVRLIPCSENLLLVSRTACGEKLDLTTETSALA